MRNIIILVITLIICSLSIGRVHDNQTIIKAIEYFSSDYVEAREKFLEASDAIDANIESFKNPNTSPKDEPLYTDIALIGPENAKVILVLISGTMVLRVLPVLAYKQDYYKKTLLPV